MAAGPSWTFQAEYIQSCNCDYGCPCNFNALPTYGNCEALIAYRITKGHYDRTSLDGVVFAWALWWPKAIHMGGGTGRVYVDAKASAEQRAAVEAITSGKHGGGVFEVFPRTFAKTYPLKTTPIEFHFEALDSWFKVDGVGEVHSEPIRNPVTKDPFGGKVDLPGGIAFKSAVVSNIRRWWMHDEDLLAYHTDRNGHVATVRFSEKGCIG